MTTPSVPPQWTVTIDGRLPLANELLRGNRWMRFRTLDQWKEWTVYACKAADVPPLGKALVTLTRYAPGKQPDFDGLVAGGKGVVDGIKQAGIMDDDDSSHLRVTYLARPCPLGKARVELVITPWGDGD